MGIYGIPQPIIDKYAAGDDNGLLVASDWLSDNGQNG